MGEDLGITPLYQVILGVSRSLLDFFKFFSWVITISCDLVTGNVSQKKKPPAFTPGVLIKPCFIRFY
jgi:hypothetical protein